MTGSKVSQGQFKLNQLLIFYFLPKWLSQANIESSEYADLLKLMIRLYNYLKTHLSKGTSDVKQKCTQLATPFWGTVFHALSHGVIHFVWSVRSRNHFLLG